MLQRISQLIQRRRNAKQLGIEFKRTANFNVPNSVVINGENIKVSLPPDVGGLVFIEVLLDDCYGLKNLLQPVHTVLDIGAHSGLFGLAVRK
jgi:hypothetical protein